MDFVFQKNDFWYMFITVTQHFAKRWTYNPTLTQHAHLKKTTHVWRAFPSPAFMSHSCHVGYVAAVITPFMSTHKAFKQAQNCHPYHHLPPSQTLFYICSTYSVSQSLYCWIYLWVTDCCIPSSLLHLGQKSCAWTHHKDGGQTSFCDVCLCDDKHLSADITVVMIKQHFLTLLLII